MDRPKRSIIPSWLNPSLSLHLETIEQCERLVHARRSLDLTQTHVGGLLGMSQQRYARVEAGKSFGTPINAVAFCALFRGELPFIFRGDDYKKPDETLSLIRKARRSKGTIKLHD